VSVLPEGLARPLRQSVGAGVQRERRDANARDDVAALRQEAVVRSADRCHVGGSAATEYDGILRQDVGSETTHAAGREQRTGAERATRSGELTDRRRSTVCLQK